MSEVGTTSELSRKPWTWRWYERPEGEEPWCLEVMSSDDVTVASMLGSADYERGMEADARLIAAAPDLLAAVENMVGLFDIGKSNYGFVTKADLRKCRDAIAKAKGESR